MHTYLFNICTYKSMYVYIQLSILNDHYVYHISSECTYVANPRLLRIFLSKIKKQTFLNTFLILLLSHAVTKINMCRYIQHNLYTYINCVDKIRTYIIIVLNSSYEGLAILKYCIMIIANKDIVIYLIYCPTI